MGWSYGKKGRLNKNWQREQIPRKHREKEGEDDRSSDGGCIKSDLEEWEKNYKRAIDRRNC